MELSKLYQAILAGVNVEADEAGLLSLCYDGTARPVTVEGKRLVLPTDTLLSSGIGPGQIAFHPLSENVARGQSPVLKKLRTLVVLRVTQVLSELLENFTRLLIDHKRHAKLSPVQKELLLTMPEADEKTHQVVEKIFEALRENSHAKLVSIYLRRAATLRLETYARAAIVSFPIMTEFENDERMIYGIKCRKADYLGLHRLLDYILPGAENVATYSHGSNDPDVPYFDALLRAFIRIAEQLNSRVDMFQKHLDHPDQLRIDLSWVPHIQSWSKYRGLIPPLSGNEGVANNEEVEEDTVRAPAPALRAFDPERAAQSQPASSPAPTTTTPTAPAPEVRKSAGGLNWQDIVNTANRRSLQPAGPALVAASPLPAPVTYSYAAPAVTSYAPPPTPVTYAPPAGYVQPGTVTYQPAPPPAPANYLQDAQGRLYDVNRQPVPLDAYGRPTVDPYGRPFAAAAAPTPVMYDAYGRPVQMATNVMPDGGPLPPGFGPDPRTAPGYGQPVVVNDRRPSFGPQAAPYGYAGGYPYPNPGFAGSGATPVYGYPR